MLNEEFHFEVDVCATTENTKCKKYFSPRDDGLNQEWKGVCWMNPPYGRQIRKWMRKAYEPALAGASVVSLVKHTKKHTKGPLRQFIRSLRRQESRNQPLADFPHRSR